VSRKASGVEAMGAARHATGRTVRRRTNAADIKSVHAWIAQCL